MGKNMTSGARRLSGNAVTLLITALLCGGSAALIYSGAASRQISNMLISMACYIVMAVSLNLVVGLLGELSLGHAGFMSVGLFTGCLLSIQLAQSVPIGVRMPLSMLLGGVAAAVVLGVGRAIGEAMAIIMVAGNVANMPGLLTPVRFLTTAIASEMSYASVGSLHRNALFSIGLVLFLFIMLINVFLNVFIKRKKED